MWQKLFWLAVAGAAGTLARYWMAGLVQRWHGGELPLGTLAVNMIGCLLFGFLWTVAEDRTLVTPQLRTVVLIGFMGAFTTFSTFMFETGQMMRDSEWLLAAGNLMVHNSLGLVCLYAGTGLASLF